jgi:hypothetical protein
VTLPGPVIEERTTAPPRSLPTDVGRWFVVGLTERGPLGPVLIGSMTEKVRIFGDRTSYDTLHDALETFFRVGGSRAYVSREVGPAAAVATANIFDQSGSSAPGDVALIATAKSVGDWGNKLNVVIDDHGSVPAIASGSFRITVTHDDLGTLEVSPDVADRDAAIAWAQTAAYIDLALGASAEDPRAQSAISLASGTDDRGSITDTHRQAALDRFGKDLGAGKVSAPGQTTQAAHSQLLAHAKDRNRTARLDFVDTPTVATLASAAALNRADPNARYGAGFAPRAVIPGLLPGTTRTVPYSAVQAGLEAKSLAQGKTAGDPAAGDNGKEDRQFVIGLSQPAWTDAERDTLNSAGVNVARVMDGVVRTYGYRTFVDPLGTKRNWLGLQKADLYMQIAADGNEIAERFEFRTIDGKRHTISDFAGELTGMLLPYYQAGVIFGETFEDAAVVDVGDQVNTIQTIAAQELHAEIAVRMSEFAERTVIGISNVPVSETV